MECPKIAYFAPADGDSADIQRPGYSFIWEFVMTNQLPNSHCRSPMV
jgi:hypothetical protein